RSPFIVERANVPFKQQEQVFYYIADRLPRLVGGALDGRGNGQYLAEQAGFKYGSGRMQAIMLSQQWYLENMPKFKAAFEDAKIEIPQDADILSDLRALQVIKGVPKLPEGKTDSKKQRHGDAAIALALAYYASLMEIEEFDYTAVRKQQSPRDDRYSRPVKVTGGFRRGSF
ncbi:MAG: hypothetical protein CMI13_11225, partial [Oleibacter sp.]|nr:hypothetical protein [Thalassolituus sp.]